MEIKDKRKSKAIGVIPFMDDYRILLNIQYEAKSKGIRVTALITDILEVKLAVDTSNPSFKAVSSEQLHRTIKKVCKGSVSNYIENACAIFIGAAAKVEVPVRYVEPAAIDQQQSPQEGKPVDRGYRMPGLMDFLGKKSE